MNRKNDVRRELDAVRVADRAGNFGKARACARRVVGMALEEWLEHHKEESYGKDHLARVQSFSRDPKVPLDLREPAYRLQAKLSADFTSASTDPVRDATTIVEFLAGTLQ